MIPRLCSKHVALKPRRPPPCGLLLGTSAKRGKMPPPESKPSLTALGATFCGAQAQLRGGWRGMERQGRGPLCVR